MSGIDSTVSTEVLLATKSFLQKDTEGLAHKFCLQNSLVTMFYLQNGLAMFSTQALLAASGLATTLAAFWVLNLLVATEVMTTVAIQQVETSKMVRGTTGGTTVAQRVKFHKRIHLLSFYKGNSEEDTINIYIGYKTHSLILLGRVRIS